MEHTRVGAIYRELQVIPAMVYFTPELEEELTGMGLDPGVMCYIGARGAALGAVPASVVRATFYNFNPEVVENLVPRLWSLAAPDELVEARHVATDRALRRMLGHDGLLDEPDVAEAADLVRRAASSAVVEGRPLAAGHQELEWPTAPHLALCHGLNVLREHRGDGHVATLVHAGLGGLPAMVSHAATGRGFLPSFARWHRGWSEGQWAAATDELAARGVLDAAGELTDEGRALRARLEDDTDRLGADPWLVLGADGVQRLHEIAGRLAGALLAAGCLPREGVFYPPR